jgi:titin
VRRFLATVLAIALVAATPSAAWSDEGPQLTSVGPVKVWVGLKNSDDVGTKFDLLAEAYQDETLVTSGHLDNVAGGSSGFNNAVLRSIALDPFPAVGFPAGSQLKIKLYVRNACLGPTHNSGTARLWYADAAANSRFAATVGTTTTDYYLLNNFALGTMAGPGPKKSIDVAAGAPCSAFKTFGAWTAVTTPGAPLSVIAIGADRQATVSWSAPASGGSPITSYTVTASPGGATVTSTSTTATLVGLQVGTTYTFAVAASNALGAGPAAVSNPATTWDYPGVPQSVTATAGAAEATVTWQAPASDGGSPVTGYTVTPYLGATAQAPTSVDGSTLSRTITGLTTGATYTFTVFAATAVGTGPTGTSPAVTLGGSVPAAPQSVAAVAGDAQATVSWQPPAADGGSAVTSYTVTPFVGSTPQTPTIVDGLATTITGLTNGTAYSFAVSATNAIGTGPAGISATVTPATVPGTPQNVGAAPGNGRAIVSWQAPTSDGGSAVTRYVVTALLGGVPQSTTNADANAVSVSVGGLSNGTAYGFTVAATNAVGTGPSATASTTPSGVPTAPLNVTASVAGADRVTVAWQPPLYDGDSPITGYVVTPVQGTTALAPVTAAASPFTVTGLTGNTTYTFRVAATNANATGPTATSAAVTTPATPCPVAGATNVWTGAAGNTSWTTAANWSAGRVPNTTDVACLPAGTPGSAAISVPTTTVRQLVSYKELTVSNGFTTTEGADLEANATWTNGTMAGPSITIGGNATITINGQVVLAGAMAITNAGTVRFVDGLFPADRRTSVTQPCGAGNTASWTNTGTLVFSDPASQSSVNLCGQFTNTATGTVTRSVGGVDSLSAGQLVNAGLIATPTGAFTLFSGAGSFVGGSVVGTPGKITLRGAFTATAAATIGDNVWVVGSGAALTGTIVIPAGATLHVGYDPANLNASNVNGVIGTISGSVTGPGTLSVAGSIFFNPSNTSIGTATVAADLQVAHVNLADYVTLATKPDGTPTRIASGTDVVVGGRVTLAGSVAIINEGTVTITVGTHFLNSQFLVGGLAGSSCSGGTGPSLTNASLLSISDAGGASVILCSLTNIGTITHHGTGRANLSATQLTTTGTVSVPTGSLQWSVGTGLISGGAVAGSNGQLIISSGTTTATADATVGDNVWVVGAATLTGTIVVPSGATVHVGYNPALEVNVDGPAGVISGSVTGAGALNAIGHFFLACGTCSIGNTATAVVAADLNVPTVALGDYATFATKPDGTAVVIGSGTSVVSNGDVRMAPATAVVNNGSVELAVGSHFVNGSFVNGGITSRLPCLAADTSSWVNNGTVVISDATGSARFTVCGSFINSASGTLRHTGGGKNTLSAASLTNLGVVQSTAGILIWSSANGLFGGGVVSGPTGQVHVVGTTVATADALVGDNVWVLASATLTGTIVITAGATVHVGHNAANPTDVNGFSGTISGLVTGAGTLTAVGQTFSNFQIGSYAARPLIAADLYVASVVIGDLTTLGIKPDGTPTTIGSGAVVTLVKVPALAAGLQLHNDGVIDFGTNAYFNCATCTLINNHWLKLYNPDGNFTHGFTIDSGTFDNEGDIHLTGFLPGTWVVFGPNVTLVGAGAGAAVFDNLEQPTWIGQITNDLRPFATALTLSGFATLRQVVQYVSASLTGLGVGQCVNVNANFSVAGASIGVCDVVDQTGSEVVMLTVSGGLRVVNWPSSGAWQFPSPLGGGLNIGAGAQAVWRIDDGGSPAFTANSDVGGPGWCQNGTLVAPGLSVGATGQHCWRPGNGERFQLNSLSLSQPGAHSFYLGPVVGTPTIRAGVTLSYSVMVSCVAWLAAIGASCPPVNIAPPTVLGTPAVDQVLTIDGGAWTPDPSLTYGYQWQRCATSSGSCSTITGATGNTYQVTNADRNFYLTARVTVTNGSGASQSATAARVGPVP